MKYTMKHINEKLMLMKNMVRQDIPEEITSELNIEKMNTLLRMTWQDPQERPYTPLVRRLILRDEDIRIPISAPLLPGEIQYIKASAQILQDTWGPPICDYSKVNSKDYPRVDAWINFIKTMAPMVTGGATKRRFDNLQKYIKQEYVFDIDWEIMNDAIQIVRELIFTKGKVKAQPDLAVNMKNYFEKQTSNVGWPYYANETSTAPDGTKFKDYTVKKTAHWLKKYGPDWIASVPATIIGRDQTGGLDIPLDQFHSIDDLDKYLIRKDIIKPSKARVVWGTPRVANNAIAPIVRPLTEYLKDNSTLFVGYKARDERSSFMKTSGRVCEKYKLFSANVDYSNYDATVSAEISILAMMIMQENLILSPFQDRVLWASLANFVETPYICWDPYKKKLSAGKSTAGIPSGSMWTNLLGSVINALISTYIKCKMYGTKKVQEINLHFTKLGSPCMTVMGDDLWSWYLKPNDIKTFAEIAKKSFNMDVSWDGVKTAYGIFFLQERVHDGKVLYPMPRVISKCLWVERPKGLNWTLWDLGFASKFDNANENPDLQTFCAMVMSLDGTKLGLISPEGVQMTPDSFRNAIARESEKYGDTPIQMVYDGDPSKIKRFDENGMPTDGFINNYFKLLREKQVSEQYPKFCNIFKVKPL